MICIPGGETVQDRLPSINTQEDPFRGQGGQGSKETGCEIVWLRWTQNQMQIRWGLFIMSTTSCFTISRQPCAVLMARTAWLPIARTAWLPIEKSFFMYLPGFVSIGELLDHKTSWSFTTDYWGQLCFACISPYLRMAVLFHVFRLCWENAGTTIAEVLASIRKGCWLSHEPQSSRASI
jgi:hypothetical protein